LSNEVLSHREPRTAMRRSSLALFSGIGRRVALAVAVSAVLMIVVGLLLQAGKQQRQYRELHQQQLRQSATLAAVTIRSRLYSAEALTFGLLSSVSGVILLWFEANPLASILALTALSSYLLIYTPLKKKTSLCTLVGAFPGAMPCLIGWAAARGSLNQESLVLYTMLFLWQFPHLLAIAWMYREDYSRAGLRMLPAKDPEGRLVSRQILAFMAALVLVSMVPAMTGQAGKVYLLAALALGGYFLFHGARLAGSRTNALARRLVLASIIYLPLILSLLMLDRVSSIAV